MADVADLIAADAIIPSLVSVGGKPHLMRKDYPVRQGALVQVSGQTVAEARFDLSA